VYIVKHHIKVFHLDRLALIACGAAGEVCAHDTHVADIYTDITTLIIIFFDSYAFDYFVGFDPGKYGYTTIAFFDRMECVTLISQRAKYSGIIRVVIDFDSPVDR
jgi:hypothetical protein